jgi:hypothetical protein
VTKVDWDNLTEFFRAEVGSIPYECWKDEASFNERLQSILRKLGRQHKVKNSFMSLDIQYLRYLQSKQDARNSVRLYAHSDDHFKNKIADYGDLVKLYDKEANHICSLIIGRDWDIELRFRLDLGGEGSSTNESYILVPAPLVEALRRVPSDLHPDECPRFYSSIADQCARYLKKVKESLVQLCPSYSDFCDGLPDSERDGVIFKQLFGSLNLVLRALDLIQV